jgi:hypothetical protein
VEYLSEREAESIERTEGGGKCHYDVERESVTLVSFNPILERAFFFFSFYCCMLIVHTKGFIVTFPHMHTMYFGHIHPSITSSYSSPVSLPFLLPNSLPCVFRTMFPELGNTSFHKIENVGSNEWSRRVWC